MGRFTLKWRQAATIASDVMADTLYARYYDVPTASGVATARRLNLAQSSPECRSPALLAFGAERLVGVVDGLVDLFDKLLADTNAKARTRLAEYHQAVATAANDKVLLLAQIVRVLLDPDLDDDTRMAATRR